MKKNNGIKVIKRAERQTFLPEKKLKNLLCGKCSGKLPER